MKKPKTFKPRQLKNKKVDLAPKRNSREMGYDKHWDKYRFRFLHYNKLCYICPEKATVVDHVVAHKGNVELFKSLTNHIPLCKQHHDYCTGKYDRSDEPKTKEKLNWLSEERANRGINRKVKVLPYYSKGRAY